MIEVTILITIFSCGRTLTTNRWPLAVSVVVHYKAVNQLFDVGPDRFVVHDVFLSVFGGSTVTLKMGMEHTFLSGDVSTSLGLLQ